MGISAELGGTSGAGGTTSRVGDIASGNGRTGTVTPRTDERDESGFAPERAADIGLTRYVAAGSAASAASTIASCSRTTALPSLSATVCGPKLTSRMPSFGISHSPAISWLPISGTSSATFRAAEAPSHDEQVVAEAQQSVVAAAAATTTRRSLSSGPWPPVCAPRRVVRFWLTFAVVGPATGRRR